MPVLGDTVFPLQLSGKKPHFYLILSPINLSTFCSPSGKLVQIEYALAAVSAGAPSVGIKG